MVNQGAKMYKKNKTNSAFSLIELSIVILIIGILVAGIVQSSRLVRMSRISTAAQITKSSDVLSIPDLALWMESTQENAFSTGSAASYAAAIANNSYTDVDYPDDLTRIGRWNDINPRATASSRKSAMQHTTASQPKYLQNGINGLPSLFFDGAGSAICMMSLLDLDRDINPKLSIFVVYRWNGGVGGDEKLFGADNGGWDRQVIFSGAPGISNGNGVQTITGLTTTKKDQILTYVSQNGVSGGSMGYINGASPTTFTETNSSEAHHALTLAANNNQSSGTALDGACGANSTNVIIAEFIVFDRALKATERLSVEKYLSKKWGIKLS